MEGLREYLDDGSFFCSPLLRKLTEEQLSVSPPLDSGLKFKPGQVFQFRLDLKPKISLSSFHKLEVRMIGDSHIYGVRLSSPPGCPR